MKRAIFVLAFGLLLAGCAREDNSEMGASPTLDTGMAEQNTVTEAGPDTAVGSGAAASSGMGTAAAHGAAVTETERSATNSPDQSPVPPQP